MKINLGKKLLFWEHQHPDPVRSLLVDIKSHIFLDVNTELARQYEEDQQNPDD